MGVEEGEGRRRVESEVKLCVQSNLVIDACLNPSKKMNYREYGRPEEAKVGIGDHRKVCERREGRE